MVGEGLEKPHIANLKDYTYLSASMYMRAYTYIIHMYVHMHTHIYIYMYMYMYVYTYVCMYVRKYVCMCIYRYAHTLESMLRSWGSGEVCSTLGLHCMASTALQSVGTQPRGLTDSQIFRARGLCSDAKGSSCAKAHGALTCPYQPFSDPKYLGICQGRFGLCLPSQGALEGRWFWYR